MTTSANRRGSIGGALPSEATRDIGRIAAIAPQFLVDDLARAVTYYRDRLGFVLDFEYDGFYASVSRDGCAIHLKAATRSGADRAGRRENEHLDAYLSVSGIETLWRELQSRGALVVKPLGERPWQCIDFYVEDADGYLLCFSQPLAPAT